jgi:hypothetical protein
MRTLILCAALLLATPLAARAQHAVAGTASVPTLRRSVQAATPRKGVAARLARPSIFAARSAAIRAHRPTGRELRARSVKKAGRE